MKAATWILIWILLATPIANASFAHNGAFISSIPYERETFKITNNLHKRLICDPNKLHCKIDDNNQSEKRIPGCAHEKRIKRFSLKTFYQAYIWKLDRNPVVTKGITSGIIQAIGDICSQSIEHKKINLLFTPDLNWRRVLSFVLSGFLFVGPYLHCWYEFLWKIGKWQEKKYGTSKTKQRLTQILVDQTLGVAIFFPLYFYIYELVGAFVWLRLPVLLNATTKMQKELSGVLLMQYRVWPIAECINFTLIPKNLRVLFSNTVSLFWDMYFCMKIS